MCADPGTPMTGGTEPGAPEPVLSAVERIREANLGIRATREPAKLKQPKGLSS